MPDAEVHVAGPLEPEPDADVRSGVSLVQRCLRCDYELLRCDSSDFDVKNPRRPAIFRLGAWVGVAYENGSSRFYVVERVKLDEREEACSYFEAGA